MVAGIAGLLALGGVYAVGALNPVPPAPITDDSLGPELGQSRDDYVRQAAASLESVTDADARWALFTVANFDCGRVFDDFGALRLSVVVHADRSLDDGLQDRDGLCYFTGPSADIVGVLVYGTNLVTLADAPGVVAAQVLPPAGPVPPAVLPPVF